MCILAPDAETMAFVQRGMFPQGPPSGPVELLVWGSPGAERYLSAYKRRDYRTPEVPKLDRSRYAIEYHSGEGSCCSKHPVIHDTDRSFVLTYEDIPIGLAGFDVDVQGAERGETRSLVVSQIQGTRYSTRHSGRRTGAEAPARSVSWQPALLNLVVALAPLVRAHAVVVVPHHARRFIFGRHNTHVLYDGTAKSCGFSYDEARELWVRTIEASGLHSFSTVTASGA